MSSSRPQRMGHVNTRGFVVLWLLHALLRWKPLLSLRQVGTVSVSASGAGVKLYSIWYRILKFSVMSIFRFFSNLKI